MTLTDLQTAASQALGSEAELVAHHAARLGGRGEFATFRNSIGYEVTAVRNGGSGEWSLTYPSIRRPQLTRDGRSFFPAYSA